MKKIFSFILICFLSSPQYTQSSFDYSIDLIPLDIPGLPGLHSYVFGQHDGKWLIIGGRKDGMHARQPFNSFPQSNNNTEIFVVDINTSRLYSESVTSLPAEIRDQLQSTNMNFYQDDDTLYIIGGYAFSATANDHVTFPHLTSVDVPGLIYAVQNSNPISSYFKQITDPRFAVTGGQLGKIGNTFYLVGGQRFDGRYNPFGGPTFTQTYATEIKKFTIDNSGAQLSIDNYLVIKDSIHLRRRDYNLVPQIFPDGSEGYMVSSGVFQPDADLPFLYPVEIKESGYYPVTSFNQYLSNYHSAKASLYDSLNNEMHSLFFGGMSRYYYQNGNLIQDDLVPFVKTISRVTRFSNGELQEHKLPIEMPALQGAGAEFLENHSLPAYKSGVIKLNEIISNEFIIGHIYGGIFSPILNPFAINQTSLTSADTIIYAVQLTRDSPVHSEVSNNKIISSVTSYPNPSSTSFTLEYYANMDSEAEYLVINILGEVIQKGKFKAANAGRNREVINLDRNIPSQIVFLKLILNDKILINKQIIRR